jgi:hypothetical protein
VQPQPQVQPVEQPNIQPANPQTVQQAQPMVQPVYQQPVVQPAVNPAVQTVQNEPAVKSNGLCTAGFVLSLLGLFLLGITSLFGLILSVVGLISANKKKQKGKGKAIAGIIMASVMLIVLALVGVFGFNNSISDILDNELNSGSSYSHHHNDDDDDDVIVDVDPTRNTSETTRMVEKTEPTETTEIIISTDTTENTTSEDKDVVGDNITGTVVLTQGAWGVWTEADGGEFDDFIWSRHQRINLETGTIFNLTTFSIVSDPDNISVFSEAAKQSMESEGTAVTDYGQTVIGGYKAYTVTGLYQDGMYLTVWYFVDKNSYLHYISIEYYPDDQASVDMIRDTYSLE